MMPIARSAVGRAAMAGGTADRGQVDVGAAAALASADAASGMKARA